MFFKLGLRVFSLNYTKLYELRHESTVAYLKAYFRSKLFMYFTLSCDYSNYFVCKIKNSPRPPWANRLSTVYRKWNKMSSDFKQKPLVRMVAFVMCLSNSFVASWRKGLVNEVLTKLIRIVCGFQGSYGWLHGFFFTMWNKIIFFQHYTSHSVLFFSFHYDNSLFARIVDNNCFNQAIFVKMSNWTMNTHLKP